MKTEELVMNFITEHEKKNGPNMPMNSAELLSLVEAAENAKEKHIAEMIVHDAEMTNHHQFAKHIRSKFLKNPEQ